MRFFSSRCHLPCGGTPLHFDCRGGHRPLPELVGQVGYRCWYGGGRGGAAGVPRERREDRITPILQGWSQVVGGAPAQRCTYAGDGWADAAGLEDVGGFCYPALEGCDAGLEEVGLVEQWGVGIGS